MTRRFILVFRSITTALLITIAHTTSLSQNAFSTHAQDLFTVMEYNVENAFDTEHDTGKNDFEFCQQGDRNWSKWRMYQKLRNIGKVIAAADEERPIDLIALCEVENDSVMTWLTERTPLANIGYKYLMTDSEDSRGIDVALMYSPFTFHPLSHRSIRPNIPNNPTRDIMHVCGTINNGDSLDVYVVHFPSKLGGKGASKRSMHIAHILKNDVDSIANTRQCANIIIMGDFNAESKSPQILFLTKDYLLTDLTRDVKPGTYKYQGRWSAIDHILSQTNSIVHDNSKALTFPFIVTKDESHGGIVPHRTYSGPIYKGGVSDHLPIVSRFHFLPKSAGISPH